MTDHAQILAGLIAHLRLSIDASTPLHVLERREDCVTIQVGPEADAVVGVQVSDPKRPSFRISYPELHVKRNGDRHVSTTNSNGVLQQGVEWIVGQVAQHGAVRPEYGV